MCIAVAKKVYTNLSENKKEHRMNSQKTVVKQTVNRDINLRRNGVASPTTSAPGRKVGEETHVEITPDRIRIRAYAIYQARNGGPGDESSDWCEAERELNGQSSSPCAGRETACDPATLEITTRSEPSRQPAMSSRGGL